MNTVLSFPQTDKARRLYSSSMDAGGMLKLLLMDRDGEAVPANVQRFDEPNGTSLPERSPALLLATLVYFELSPAKQEHVRQALRCMAYTARHPDPSAVALLNMLNGKG